MRHADNLTVRWTIGDVSDYGFETLGLSIRGARAIFGPAAEYVVCVNSVPLLRARELTGDVPSEVQWLDVTGALDPLIASHIDEGMAEGVGWKFAPLQIAPDRYELALDNDCVLWRAPAAIREWLDSDDAACVIAEDVRPAFGRYTALLGEHGRNSGIRGLPPQFDLRGALTALLDGVMLECELDEQGLQVAAVSCGKTPLVVRVAEVAICSPFPPHLQDIGTCGVHFVGLNAKQLWWEREGRPATEETVENYTRLLPRVREALNAASPLSPPGRGPG